MLGLLVRRAGEVIHHASNVSHADFDNDGKLDVLLLRGAWDSPYRLSLMRNKGDGRRPELIRAVRGVGYAFEP